MKEDFGIYVGKTQETKSGKKQWRWSLARRLKHKPTTNEVDSTVKKERGLKSFVMKLKPGAWRKVRPVKTDFWTGYENNYKKYMIIPLITLIFFSGVIIYNKAVYGEYFFKDISLKGGTSITLYTTTIPGIEEWLTNNWPEAELVMIKDSIGNFKGYDFRTAEELTISDAKEKLSNLTDKVITENDFSMGYQSASIASSFFNEFGIIILISFTLMGLVALYYFKSPINALTTAFATLTNIIVVVGMMNLLKEPLSVPGIGAILMLLGLSTDTDILLASNLVNKSVKESVEKLRRIFMTELTISIAAITNALVIYLLTGIDVIRSIALILLIGTIADLMSTIFFSSGLMIMYNEWRQKR